MRTAKNQNLSQPKKKQRKKKNVKRKQDFSIGSKASLLTNVKISQKRKKQRKMSLKQLNTPQITKQERKTRLERRIKNLNITEKKCQTFQLQEILNQNLKS